MKLLTFVIFAVVSLLAYSLGRHDGIAEYDNVNSSIQEIMSGIDITQFANEEEIRKYVSEKIGMKPEDIFVERVVIDSDKKQ